MANPALPLAPVTVTRSIDACMVQPPVWLIAPRPSAALLRGVYHHRSLFRPFDQNQAPVERQMPGTQATTSFLPESLLQSWCRRGGYHRDHHFD